ncbi:MAG TPA: hypothetical protein VEZ55_05590, partial [Chitinophagaceae bacterium]|nr:hypothetical protein [Chitinophagaceae bacterium]
MKNYLNKLLLLMILGVATFAIMQKLEQKNSDDRRQSLEESRKKRKARKAAFSEARTRYEYDMLKDPATGKIPAGIFQRELAFAKTLPVKGLYINPAARGSGTLIQNEYIPAGPNNIGGRTRALSYDMRYNGSTNRVIIAGSVSSGIMRSEDGGNTWTLVTPDEDTHSFTALAQDPRPGFQDTWYAGGGEAYGNTTSELGATYLGNGLWRSTNNGATWSKLPMNNITDVNGTPIGQGTLENFDHPFDFVHKIMVNPLNGNVYVAGHRRLLRSADNGLSFQTVFGSNTAATSGNGQMDVAINNLGRIFLAVNGGNPDRNLRGVWVSNTGNTGTFSRIAGGQTAGVNLVPGWRANSEEDTSRRILITLAPSNQNIGYVYYENGVENETLQPEADLFRFEVSGNTFTWINRSANMPDFPGGNLVNSDPLDVQDGYNMLVTVKPDDPNFVLVGGTNLYRSTDGFATNTRTAWINGYAPDFSYQHYPNGHADQHSFTFNPANLNQAICGDDGGIRFSSNITANNVSWSPLPNYQTLQYYYVSIDPEKGKFNFIGGSQDNGVLLRDKARTMGTPTSDSNNHVRLLGGDGGAIGVAQRSSNGNQFVYGSSQLGDIRRIRIAPTSASTEIQPDNLTPNDEGGFGEFVTNLRLDPDNNEDLYYVNFNRLFRTTTASTVTSSTWTELVAVGQAVNTINNEDVSIRALAFSRGAYNPTRALFIGTTNGKIFRLDDPRNAAPSKVPVNITPSQLTGNVQDIAVNPLDDNELLAVVSNYNTVSIWWTNNARSAAPTWRNAEGNLTLPSMRSCVIVADTTNGSSNFEYYVGTSVGLYSVSNLGALLTTNQRPVWQREGSRTLNYAVVQSIAYRPSDNTLVIGTHGNGMFYTIIGESLPPPVPGGEDVFIELIAPTYTNGPVNYRVGNLTTVKKIMIRVFNASGQLMQKEERSYENGPPLDLSRFASGMYIISISSD